MNLMSQSRCAGHETMARRSQQRQSGYTILVVDDDQAILMSVRALLVREGHTVITAESGNEALEVYRHNDIHLMLVDYFMPRMTGEELIAQIRRVDPILQIVLQTGYAGEKPPREMLRDLDIQGYHDKSRGPQELLLWIDVALKAYERLQQLRDREQLQAELVSNVSHEFRTPLNIIGGYTELLAIGEFGEMGERASEILGRVQDACRDLSDLVGDFLGYARVEANVEEIGDGPIHTEEFAEDMAKYARLILGDRKPIAFEVDYEDAPRTFYSDLVKVKTIVRNLVTNAVKFTENGMIALRIGMGVDGSVTIEVEDTGLGIAPEAQDMVFEPFRQLDGSITRAHGGVGLGLALSRKLARVLGGDLVVRSALGEGSTFALTLPAAPAQVLPSDPASDAWPAA